MLISQIYKNYNIPPGLQLHMYRVTGVAFIICNHFNEGIDRNTILSTCFLHDMGNIIKFNFDLLPELFEEKGIEYWKQVQQEFIKKYGNDEHTATRKIAEEIGVSKKIIDILENLGFSKARQIFFSTDYNLKISSYADQRVSIKGIVPMEERHREGRTRYLKRSDLKSDKSVEKFEKRAVWMQKLEKQIFGKTDISPTFITDDAVNKQISNFYDYEIV